MTNTLSKKINSKREIYEKYKENFPNLDFTHKLLLDFEKEDNFNFKLIFPNYLSKIENTLLVKQFCLNKIFGLLSTSSIFWEIAKYNNNKNYGIVVPASIEILNFLKSKKIKVNYFFSLALFFILKLKYLVSGFLFVCNFLLFNQDKKKFNKSYLFVFDINADAIPNSDKELSYLNWVKKYLSQGDKIFQNKYNLRTAENINIFYSKFNFPKPKKFFELIQFFFSFFIYSILFFLSLFNFKSFSAFFYRDFFESKIIDLTKKSKLAKFYIFNNVTRNYRPLWTYNPKVRNKIYYIFYGLNEFPIYFKNENKPLQNIGWSLMNWPTYIGYNKTFFDYLDLSLNHKSKKIFFNEPVWYRDNNKDDEYIKFNNNFKTIAIYDVTPINYLKNFSWTKRAEYINDRNNIIKFYNDIINITKKYNINLIIKYKKNNRNDDNVIYDDLFVNETYLKNINFVNSNKSPKHINSSVDAIISYPFTSAAYFNPKNLPSIYYDPASQIDIDKQINFGVPLIGNLDNLENWIRHIIQ